jgi:hypothetical protein
MNVILFPSSTSDTEALTISLTTAITAREDFEFLDGLIATAQSSSFRSSLMEENNTQTGDLGFSGGKKSCGYPNRAYRRCNGRDGKQRQPA